MFTFTSPSVHSTPLQATGGVEVKGKGLMHTFLWREEAAEEAAGLLGGRLHNLLPLTARQRSGGALADEAVIKTADSSPRLSAPTSASLPGRWSGASLLAAPTSASASTSRATSAASLTKLSRLHASSTLAKLPEFPPAELPSDLLIQSGSSTLARLPEFPPGLLTAGVVYRLATVAAL